MFSIMSVVSTIPATHKDTPSHYAFRADSNIDVIEPADLVPSVRLETCRSIAETVRELARDGQVFSEEDVTEVERWVKRLEL
ncbi:hypothetical protein B0A48_16376 [Cryoendolithus antarcticus]|uniref:Uncharacterized protein n=1 Tax=Cryoendolithus antarcticus TaxID=1507870 RepID=A0A1V8SDS9_9PEZI|nr:hypothetical protein B0A48_16376 [Cryoendolithus antarcticus]